MKEVKKYRHLSYEERIAIAIGQQQGLSVRAIARTLGRSPSTISRECRRNAPASPYSCIFAQQRYQRRRRFCRPRPKLGGDSPLFTLVCQLLRKRWSPQQIAAHLSKVHGSDRSQRLSHETIYTCIYAQPRGELRRELIACLRMARAKRWPRSRGTDRRGEIADLLSIHVRPPQVTERQFPGHWEGDLIKGASNASAVGTLVERTSRLLMLVQLPHPQPATAAHVLQAFSDKLLSVAQPMRQTMTYDRGKEMAFHRQLSERTGIAVYFCDPHSPWQRGTNENTNGLVRQYLPKGTDLSGYSQQQLDAIADEINHRPRKTLGWASPIEVYRQWLDKLNNEPLSIQ
ncbi:MAG: IS30 family transposase [Burkholderiaceae bacterium]|nr:IS30 family transposase [Burkholderiaceae bacterium]